MQIRDIMFGNTDSKSGYQEVEFWPGDRTPRFRCFPDISGKKYARAVVSMFNEDPGHEDIQLHALFNNRTGYRKWVSFTFRQVTPSTQRHGGSPGYRIGLYIMGNENSLTPTRKRTRIIGSPIRNLVSILTELARLIW